VDQWDAQGDEFRDRSDHAPGAGRLVVLAGQGAMHVGADGVRKQPVADHRARGPEREVQTVADVEEHAAIERLE